MVPSLVILLLGAAPGADEAAELFNRMERQILSCETLRVQAKITVEPEKDSPLTARLFVEGPRLRFDLAGTMKATPVKTSTVSNGTKMRTTFKDRPPVDREPPVQLGKRALTAFARAGFFAGLTAVLDERDGPGQRSKAFDLDGDFAVSGFKLGKKATTKSGKELHVLGYKLTPKGSKEAVAVTVWLDAETDLPLQRVIRLKDKEETVTIRETYSRPVLAGHIEDKVFQLPRWEVTKDKRATEVYRGKHGTFTLSRLPGVWVKSDKPAVAGPEAQFVHKDGDVMALVTTDRINMPFPALRKQVVDTVRREDKEARVLEEEKRTVNGSEVLFLRVNAKPKGVPFTFLYYLYSGDTGTIVLSTWTGQDLFKAYRSEMETLLNGLEIVKK